MSLVTEQHSMRNPRAVLQIAGLNNGQVVFVAGRRRMCERRSEVTVSHQQHFDVQGSSSSGQSITVRLHTSEGQRTLVVAG